MKCGKLPLLELAKYFVYKKICFSLSSCPSVDHYLIHRLFIYFKLLKPAQLRIATVGNKLVAWKHVHCSECVLLRITNYQKQILLVECCAPLLQNSAKHCHSSCRKPGFYPESKKIHNNNYNTALEIANSRSQHGSICKVKYFLYTFNAL